MAYTILYIEDEPLIVELVADVLTHPDVILVTAPTDRKGFAKIRELRPDIILLDVMTPDCDGWGIYEDIRADEMLRNIPIIILSAQAHKYRLQHEFEKSPIDAYITKPFSARDLRKEIEKMLSIQLWPSTTRSKD